MSSPRFILQVGCFDPYSDDPRLGVQKVVLCKYTAQMVVAGTAGQVHRGVPRLLGEVGCTGCSGEVMEKPAGTKPQRWGLLGAAFREQGLLLGFLSLSIAVGNMKGWGWAGTQVVDEPWEGGNQWVWVTAVPLALSQFIEGAQCVLTAKWEMGMVLLGREPMGLGHRCVPRFSGPGIQ